eukprot:CAMPEP_0180080390 /NCGR_PEP_ID=MMETSP0985-20121206/17492_1 /TAXON_ID=483367 /ORGANISM="non described non described, Strain CCMP 2436" /LENGTH=183 /DNA_ID=CAMNT_0022013361 /DNA_START=127 /DNA_END=676 /DNA_ORIENTATION=-
MLELAHLAHARRLWAAVEWPAGTATLSPPVQATRRCLHAADAAMARVSVCSARFLSERPDRSCAGTGRVRRGAVAPHPGAPALDVVALQEARAIELVDGKQEVLLRADRVVEVGGRAWRELRGEVAVEVEHVRGVLLLPRAGRRGRLRERWRLASDLDQKRVRHPKPQQKPGRWHVTCSARSH